MNSNIDIKYFRILALVEGTSFLILMFIAMPMKRLMGMPEAVRAVGGIHGMLFLMYIYTLFTVSMAHKWPAKKAFLAFLSAVIPFGPFWFERKYLKTNS
jgi:integral membrane protein